MLKQQERKCKMRDISSQFNKHGFVKLQNFGRKPSQQSYYFQRYHIIQLSSHPRPESTVTE